MRKLPALIAGILAVVGQPALAEDQSDAPMGGGDPSARLPGLCAGMKAVPLPRTGDEWTHPGSTVIRIDRNTRVDVELIAGGGGGGASRAGSDWKGGLGGHSSEFKPIFQRLLLEPDFYLLTVGDGGDGGLGGWNWNEQTAAGQGHGKSGGDTTLMRCSSGAILAIVHGGSGGEAETAPSDNGERGQDFVDIDHGKRTGTGGPGGAAGRVGKDGGRAEGFGAGGGGQGKTDTQNDGQSRGGRGANGYAKITLIGEH